MSSLKWLVTLPQILNKNLDLVHAAWIIIFFLGQSGILWLLQADRLSDYQDIYDWNSKFQKPFSITHSLLGNMSTVKAITQRFLLFEVLLDHFEAQLFKANTISQTLTRRKAMHLRFNIVKRCLQTWDCPKCRLSISSSRLLCIFKLESWWYQHQLRSNP